MELNIGQVYTFGYDIENVQEVQMYLQAEYKESIDYRMDIGRGDDIMNSFTPLHTLICNDNILIMVINGTAQIQHYNIIMTLLPEETCC